MTLNRNPFHPSPKDPIVHATISYEKQDGSFVKDELKHVAENAAEQALVSSVSNFEARMVVINHLRAIKMRGNRLNRHGETFDCVISERKFGCFA